MSFFRHGEIYQSDVGGNSSVERAEDGVRRLVIEGNQLPLAAKAKEMVEDHERQLVGDRIALGR